MYTDWIELDCKVFIRNACVQKAFASAKYPTTTEYLLKFNSLGPNISRTIEVRDSVPMMHK